jgi:hypothetical protein
LYTVYEYITYIYYFDGFLREIFLDADNAENFEFDWGEKIIQADDFQFNFNNEAGRIEMSLTDRDGSEQSTIVTLRSQG